MSALRIALFWLSSFAFAIIGLFGLFPITEERAFEDAALGDQTQTVIGMYEGERVHCFTMDDGAECLAPAKVRGLKYSILWLGNSQLHAINQLKEGDLLGSVQLARALRPEDIDVLTFSQPNANLQEHLVLFETLSVRHPIDRLLLPVVFDDTREGQIRPDILSSLHDHQVAVRLLESSIGRKILENIAESEDAEVGPQTLQDRSEAAITASLQSVLGWEDLRARARGTVSLTLYQTRNTIFGITPNSVRRKIPGTYAANMAAFEQTLISAKKRGTQVLVYVPPLRGDVARPYDPLEYAAFKAEAAALANKHGADFVDLENIVPGPLWGTKAATGLGDEPENDFMHFQGQGHDLLAKALLQKLTELGK